MAKTLSREIDLTMGRYFTKKSDLVDNNDTLISSAMWESMDPKVKFPWNKSFKKKDGTFTNHIPYSSDNQMKAINKHGDPHWNYLGFKYYGGVKEPFYMGDREKRKFSRLALEEEYFFETEGSVCPRCGKTINVFDLDSKWNSACNYLPCLCAKCLEAVLDGRDGTLFSQYKEKPTRGFNKVSDFTSNLERRSFW